MKRVFLLGLFLIMSCFASTIHARDNGQWTNSDPEVANWYRHLMRPDAPTSSCCGEADAYWCDKISVEGTKTYCTITDDRDDGPLMRPHRAIGTKIYIPNEKLKWDEGNPTGHSIVFLSTSDYVWCFVQSSGT